MNTLTIILILIAGIIIGVIFSARKKDSKKGKNESLILKQSIIKEENKDKILVYLNNNEKITNNDVEKLVGVSDATATRYLEELEQEGKINQIGKTGHYVYYQLK